MSQPNESLLIPDKEFFSISEVAELCDVQPHVLRYWEQEFAELSPDKRKGGRRYYQRKDIETVQKIKELLYQRGFTIAGAKQQLKQQKSVNDVTAVELVKPVETLPANPVRQDSSTRIVAEMIASLKTVLRTLRS